MHLVDALARMHLAVEHNGEALSVPFSTKNVKMTLLKGPTALAARRHVASRLSESTIAALQRPLNPEAPDLELMQQLYDAGIGKCPGSGMPVFDPSACSPELREAIWRSYVGVATAVNTSKLGGTGDALVELVQQLSDHCD